MAISLHKPTIGFNRMPVKSSYPKLHSIKMKSGIHGPSLPLHPNAATEIASYMPQRGVLALLRDSDYLEE